MGGDLHLASLAWGTEMERLTGVSVRMVPEGNTNTKLRLLRAGIIDLYSTSASEQGSSGMEVRGAYATREGGPFETRIVWLSRSNYVGYIVRGDSDIKTASDLKGKKIGVCLLNQAMQDSMDALLAWGDISWDEVTRVEFGSWPANVKSIAEGKTDVVMVLAAASHTVEAAAAPHGIRFLDLDPKKEPEAMKRFNEVRPTVQLGKATRGVKEAMGVSMMALNFFFVALEKTDAELVYQFCKWLDENYDVYKSKNETAATLVIDNFRSSLNGVYLPVHKGTIRYLKEKGMWTAADDTTLKENLDLISKYQAAFQAAVDEADKAGIKIDPQNEKWTELWQNAKKDLPRFKVAAK